MSDAQDGIGVRLRRFLRFRGLSIREFSEETAIPYRTLQNYLSEQRKPGAEHLKAMADYGVDVNWLLGARAKPMTDGEMLSAASESTVVRADIELLQELRERAVKLTDEMQKRYVEENRKPLNLMEILNFFSKTYLHFRKLAEGMESSIENLRKLGVSTPLIVDIISEAVVKAAERAQPSDNMEEP